MPRASRGALYGRRILSRPATPYYKLFFDRCQAFSSIYLRTTENARSAFFFCEASSGNAPRFARGIMPKANFFIPPRHPVIISWILNLVKHFLAFYFEKLSIVHCPLYHQQRLTAHNQRTLSAVRL